MIHRKRIMKKPFPFIFEIFNPINVTIEKMHSTTRPRYIYIYIENRPGLDIDVSPSINFIVNDKEK